MSAGLVAARSKLAVYQGVPRPPRTLSSMLLLLLRHRCMHPHSHNRSSHTHHHDRILMFRPMSWAHRDDQWRPTSMLHVDTVQVKKWQICKNSIINKSSRAWQCTTHLILTEYILYCLYLFSCGRRLLHSNLQ